ncbi:hypothetical protein Hanom_Chr02g00143561 [Helianthus anomalus]
MPATHLPLSQKNPYIFDLQLKTHIAFSVKFCETPAKGARTFDKHKPASFLMHLYRL